MLKGARPLLQAVFSLFKGSSLFKGGHHPDSRTSPSLAARETSCGARGTWGLLFDFFDSTASEETWQKFSDSQRPSTFTISR